MKRTLIVLPLLSVLILCLGAGCAAQSSAQGTEAPDPSLTAVPAESEESPARTEPKFESAYYQNGAFALPEVVPAQTPEACDSFVALDWGDPYDRLFDEGLAQFVTQYGVTYVGFMGTAYYSFREGALWNGQIVFYELPDKSDLDIYIELRNHCLETYGEALPADTTSEFSAVSTLENIMQTGEGFCAEAWSVQTSQGESVHITLMFDAADVQTPGGGRTAITFSVPVP